MSDIKGWEITRFVETDESKGRVIALGLFDGVHLGHRKIISRASQIAKDNGLTSAVLTFKGFRIKDNTELTDLEGRKKLFRELGVDEVICLDFETIKDIDAKDFVNDFLLGAFNSRVLISGTDYTFGKGAKGNVELLENFESEGEFELEIIPDVIYEGQKCSSTLIRKLLSEGETEKANALLGDVLYSYSGKVVKGKMLGRTLGFPTANLPISNDRFKAKFGVYMTKTTINGKTYKSVSNLGLRPTVEDSTNVNIETFIYGLDHDGNDELYGKDIKVELIKFIREEMKFGSVEELRLQVESDKKKVANLWELDVN